MGCKPKGKKPMVNMKEMLNDFSKKDEKGEKGGKKVVLKKGGKKK